MNSQGPAGSESSGRGKEGFLLERRTCIFMFLFLFPCHQSQKLNRFPDPRAEMRILKLILREISPFRLEIDNFGRHRPKSYQLIPAIKLFKYMLHILAIISKEIFRLYEIQRLLHFAKPSLDFINSDFPGLLSGAPGTRP